MFVALFSVSVSDCPRSLEGYWVTTLKMFKMGRFPFPKTKFPVKCTTNLVWVGPMIPVRLTFIPVWNLITPSAKTRRVRAHAIRVTSQILPIPYRSNSSLLFPPPPFRIVIRFFRFYPEKFYLFTALLSPSLSLVYVYTLIVVIVAHSKSMKISSFQIFKKKYFRKKKVIREKEGNRRT